MRARLYKFSTRDIGPAVKLRLKRNAPAGTDVLAFPLARRRNLVKKLAEQMLARSPREAERHLGFELERHRGILRRRQLADSTIEAELSTLRCVVRNELWRIVMAPSQPGSGG
jgi:hypothetical protein